MHLYQTHDLWHVLTGFKTNPSGELGLQAFYYAQYSLPLPILLIAAGLLNGLLYHPNDVTNRLNEIQKGWQMGKNAEQLFGFPWAEHWDTPVDVLRRTLRIVPVALSMPDPQATYA